MSSDTSIAEMETALAKARESAAHLSKISGIDHFDTAVVLGSGWHEAIQYLGEKLIETPAAEIPGFIPSTVQGHRGTISVYRMQLADKTRHILVIGSRSHLYEGNGVQAVAHGARVAHAAGCRNLILTNGSGGINPSLELGKPVLIKDHINFTGQSPISGATFFDMSDAYAVSLRKLAQSVDPTLKEGVYIQFRGPQYETPAEIALGHRLGADIVGMSTALETIAAAHLGLEVLGISLVTNAAAGVSGESIEHHDVLAAGERAAGELGELLGKIVHKILEDIPLTGRS